MCTLQALASVGIASRRGADAIILEGRVKVNGQVVTTPFVQVDLSKDKLAVDGRPLSTADSLKKYYFALNKPKGFICSNTSDKAEWDGRLVINLFDDWIAQWKTKKPAVSTDNGDA